MSIKVSVHQLQDRLPELLDQVVLNGEECVVQRDGTDFAVLVSAQQWRRRTVGQRLDRLGESHRLSKIKQARVTQLLSEKKRRALTTVERRELKALLRDSDAILLRRAATIDGRP